MLSKINSNLAFDEKFGNVFGHGAFPGKGTPLIGAIHFQKLVIFLDSTYHTAAVLRAAVAAEKFFLFHILDFLYNGKAHRGEGQAVGGACQPLAVEYHIPGDVPILRAVVDIYRNGFVLKAPAESYFSVFCG